MLLIFRGADRIARRSQGRRIAAAVVFVLACQVLVTGSFSQQQQQQSREREALRRSQAAAQKAVQEKAQLQDQNAKLEKERQDLSVNVKASQKLSQTLKGQLAAAKKKETEQSQQIEQLRQEVSVAKTRISDMEAKVRELNTQVAENQEQNRQLAGQVKTYETQLGQQREIIGRQSQALQALDAKNLKLYQLNVELLDKYNKKSTWDALMQHEPFTQIKDVQIQGLLQEYRDKNDALKTEKPELRQ
jgi:chromosome segregation ATPase